jgi:uncharacterized DUF497 family protein
MPFIWDPSKAERNFAKHGIAFEEAWEFEWAGAVVVDRSRRADGEVRRAAIGLLRDRVCTLIFTDRPEGVRLISFRRSNRAEERVYEEIGSKTSQSRR